MTRHRVWVHLALALVLLAWPAMALANGGPHGHHVCPPHPINHHHHGYWGGYYVPYWYWPNYYEVPSYPPTYYYPPTPAVETAVTGAVSVVQPPHGGSVGYLIVGVSRPILGGREETRARYYLTAATTVVQHGQTLSWSALKSGAPVTVHVLSGVVIRVELLGS